MPPQADNGYDIPLDQRTNVGISVTGRGLSRPLRCLRTFTRRRDAAGMARSISDGNRQMACFQLFHNASVPKCFEPRKRAPRSVLRHPDDWLAPFQDDGGLVDVRFDHPRDRPVNLARASRACLLPMAPIGHSIELALKGEWVRPSLAATIRSLHSLRSA
jgi:hypothetical protein